MRTPSRLTHIVSAGLLALAAWSASPSAAAADAVADTAAAQALFDQGRQLMSNGNYSEACPKFEESARIMGHSGTLLNLADCYEKQGRVSSAWTTFLSAAAAAKRTDNVDRETEARNRANTLVPMLPKIVIKVHSEDASSGIRVTRDDATVGQAQFGVAIPADPGTHKVTASLPGHRTWEASIELKASGGATQVNVPKLEMLPAIATNQTEPKPPLAKDTRDSHSNSQRTWALAVGGVGIAGVAVGGVAGLVSLSKKGKANDHCNGSLCNDSQGVTLRSDARTWGNVSTVAFMVGGAGLVTGVALWLTSPRPKATAAAWMTLGPGNVGINGVW